MASNGTSQRYASPAIALHWTLAAAILVALPLGFLAANAADAQHAAALLRIHAPLGLAILALTLGRAAWRYRHAPPPAPAGQPRWQVGAARITHILLHVVPLLTAISGLALMASSGAGPVVFSHAPGGLPDFSHLPPMRVHALGAFALVALVGLHLAAVVYHQLLRRDRPLARMGIGAPPGIAR